MVVWLAAGIAWQTVVPIQTPLEIPLEACKPRTNLGEQKQG